MTNREGEKGRGVSSVSASDFSHAKPGRPPRKNKAGYEPYSMLVWELGKLGILRRSDLEGLIARRLAEALAEDGEVVEQRTSRSVGDSDVDHFFTHTGLLNVMLEKEFGTGVHSIIFDQVQAELEASEQKRTGRSLTGG